MYDSTTIFSKANGSWTMVRMYVVQRREKTFNEISFGYNENVDICLGTKLF